MIVVNDLSFLGLSIYLPFPWQYLEENFVDRILQHVGGLLVVLGEDADLRDLRGLRVYGLSRNDDRYGGLVGLWPSACRSLAQCIMGT